MKVSIITVCHNQLAHTKRFVASLKRFTPQEPIAWDLLIIESGCTDGTNAWLYESPDKFGRVHIKENIGWVRGINEGIKFINEWNKGVRQTPPDILIFCNNDIVFEPNWLTKLVAHFDNPTVGAVGPTSNYVIGRQNTACNVPHVTEEETNTLIGFCMAVKKEIVDELGGLDESLSPGGIGGGDDHDYSIRIRRNGWRLVIARDVFVFHAGSKTFMERLGPEGYNQHWRACDKALEAKWGELEVRQLFDSPLKVAIGLPMRGWHPHWKFAKSLFFLQKPANFNLIEAPRGMIDQNRNQIADAALKLGADFVLMLDDDHTFPPDLLYRLLAYNKDVVGALGFRRIEPFGPCVFSWITSKENGNLMVIDRPDLIRKGLQKVDAVGFGAVLIRMEIFKRLGPQPWFRFSEVGEDLHFCDLCAQAGIDVWCDTDLVIPHIVDDGIEVTDATFFQHHQFKAAKQGAA